MRVRIDLGLDLNGLHTFRWEPSEGPGGLEVPKTTLDRWTAEREAFRLAYLRWMSVIEEMEEALYTESEGKKSPRAALAQAVAAVKARQG